MAIMSFRMKCVVLLNSLMDAFSAMKLDKEARTNTGISHFSNEDEGFSLMKKSQNKTHS